MCTSTQRLLSAFILALWMAPSVGALGVGLHLAFDHHHSHEAEHHHDIEGLARAVAHGHHHDAQATPDHEHEHEARIDGTLTVLTPSPSSVALLSSPSASTTQLGERSILDRSLRRGPPAPLFTAHCSLLL